jgi:hypothetical protein
MHHWLRRCGRAACPRPQRKALDASMVQQDHRCCPQSPSPRAISPPRDNVRDMDYLADRYPARLVHLSDVVAGIVRLTLMTMPVQECILFNVSR